MADSVLILAADANYSGHARSLFVNCRLQGGWTGDTALIVPKGELAVCPHLADAAGRGIRIHEAPDTGFMLKFWMFADWFDSYDRALWLDCDVLVQRPLAPISSRPFSEDALLSMESGTVRDTFWRDKQAAEHREVYQWMAREFMHFGQATYNTSCVLFKPKAFPPDTPQRLRDLQQKIEPANHPDRGGTDQQVINLLLYEQFGEIPSGLFAYWGLMTPDTVVAHYCRWYGPWLNKRSDADAYFNEALNAPCKEIYDENLAKFDEVFPKC